MLQYTYHNVKDMEFSGFFQAYTNAEKYFLFVKFRELIYIDVKGIGAIIIPFERLLKHKYLRMYYEISTHLIKNTHQVIEEKRGGYYAEEINWFIDTAYFVKHGATITIESGKYGCYYNMNPNDLRDACVSCDEDIATFFRKLNRSRRSGRSGRSGRSIHFVDYANLMLEYNIASIEEELEKLSASEEDNKNIMVLLELNNKKKEMNTDIFMMLYVLVVSKEGQKKYVPV